MGELDFHKHLLDTDDTGKKIEGTKEEKVNAVKEVIQDTKMNIQDQYAEVLQSLTAADLTNIIEKKFKTESGFKSRREINKNDFGYAMIVQSSMKMLGSDPGSIDADYGIKTKDAVEAFQQIQKDKDPERIINGKPIMVDGLCGPQTFTLIVEQLALLGNTDPVNSETTGLTDNQQLLEKIEAGDNTIQSLLPNGVTAEKRTDMDQNAHCCLYDESGKRIPLPQVDKDFAKTMTDRKLSNDKTVMQWKNDWYVWDTGTSNEDMGYRKLTIGTDGKFNFDGKSKLVVENSTKVDTPPNVNGTKKEDAPVNSPTKVDGATKVDSPTKVDDPVKVDAPVTVVDPTAKKEEDKGKEIPTKSPITNPEADKTSTDVVKETPQSNDPSVFLEQGKINYMMKLKKDALKGSVDSYQFTDEQTKKLKKVMQINDDGDVKDTWKKAIESATDDAALLKVTTRINQQMNQVNKDLSKNFWRKLGLKKESTVEDVVSKKAKTFENKQDVKDLLVATNTVNLNETKVDTETAKNNADAAMDGYLSLFTQLKDASSQTQKADAENITATGNAKTELKKTREETGSIITKDDDINAQANKTKEAGAIQSDKTLTLEEAKNKEIQLSNDIMPKATQFTNSVTEYIAKIQESKEADKGNISALTGALKGRVDKDKGVFTTGFGDTSTAWKTLLGDINTFDGEYKKAKSEVVTEQTDDAGNTIPIIQEDQIALMYTKSEAITQTRSELEKKTNLGLQQYADLSITIQSLYEMIQDDASKKVDVLVNHIGSLTGWKDKVTTQINDVNGQVALLRKSRTGKNNAQIDASIKVMEDLKKSLETTKTTIIEPEIKKLEDEKLQFENKVTAAKNANLYTQGVTKQRMINFWTSQKKSEVAFEENLVGLLSVEKTNNGIKENENLGQIGKIDQNIGAKVVERQTIYDAQKESEEQDKLQRINDEIQKRETEKEGLKAINGLLQLKNGEIDKKLIESNKSITEGKIQIAGYENQSTDLGAQLQKLVNETPNADLNDYPEFFPVKTYTENNLQLESPFEQK